MWLKTKVTQGLHSLALACWARRAPAAAPGSYLLGEEQSRTTLVQSLPSDMRKAVARRSGVAPATQQ